VFRSGFLDKLDELGVEAELQHVVGLDVAGKLRVGGLVAEAAQPR
jgi:hypothetical protein